MAAGVLRDTLASVVGHVSDSPYAGSNRTSYRRTRRDFSTPAALGQKAR